MPSPPWKAASTGVDAVLARWLASSWVKPCFCADETLHGTDGQYAPLPSYLAPGLVRAMHGRGIDRLYAHQARALEATRAGRHLVVATPTASGKSLCFHLPVLQAAADDPDARAIYLYPTKALARDQEAGLRELMTAAEMRTGAVVYDAERQEPVGRGLSPSCLGAFGILGPGLCGVNHGRKEERPARVRLGAGTVNR